MNYRSVCLDSGVCVVVVVRDFSRRRCAVLQNLQRAIHTNLARSLY